MLLGKCEINDGGSDSSEQAVVQHLTLEEKTEADECANPKAKRTMYILKLNLYWAHISLSASQIQRD